MDHPNNATFEQIAQDVCHLVEDLLTQSTEMRIGRGNPVKRILDHLHRALPKITDSDTADRMLQRVLDNCPLKCAWMVAVVYGRVDSLFHLNNTIAIETMHMDFLHGAALYLAENRMWFQISAIFDHSPHLVYEVFVHRELFNFPIENDPAGVELFQKIVRQANDCDPEGLSTLVRDVNLKGLVEQFKVLVNSPISAVRQEVAANLKPLMADVCVARMGLGLGAVRSARLGACFMTAVQAGLFAAVRPEIGRVCMAMAAVANQPDLVLCLHHCGTLSSGDFSAMLGHYNVKAIGSKDPARVWGLPSSTVPFDEKAKKIALSIKRFLAKQASTPSTLKKMCLQHLSKEVGWGHDREERIREADILESLKDDLRFKGLEEMLRKEFKQT